MPISQSLDGAMRSSSGNEMGFFAMVLSVVRFLNRVSKYMEQSHSNSKRTSNGIRSCILTRSCLASGEVSADGQVCYSRLGYCSKPRMQTPPNPSSSSTIPPLTFILHYTSSCFFNDYCVEKDLNIYDALQDWYDWHSLYRVLSGKTLEVQPGDEFC